MGKKKTARTAAPPLAASSSASSSSASSSPIPTPPADPSYFSQFDDFTPSVDANFLEQFNALALQKGWNKNERKQRRFEAIIEEFDYLYGADSSNLAQWQALCREVGLEEIPESITKCRKALASRKVMVNLVDLINHRRRGTPLRKFANYQQFCAYTRKHPFPRNLAKQEGFIKALLRKVI